MKLGRPVPTVREVFQPPPLEDSPDFTADDIACAIQVATPQAMADSIGTLCCLFCQARLAIKGQALKRRDGLHYSKVEMHCINSHTESRVFRLDWLKGAP